MSGENTYTLELLVRIADGEPETLSKAVIAGNPDDALIDLPEVLVHTASGLFNDLARAREEMNRAYES